MTSTVGSIFPVFAVILMGFGSVRLGLLHVPGLRGMNDFVFFAAMPCLIFGSMTDAPPVGVLTMSVVFLGTALLLFLLAIVLGRVVFGTTIGQSAMFALNSVFGNTVLLGLPVIQTAFGAEGVASLLAVVAFHSAVLLPLASVLMELDGTSGKHPLQVLRSVVPALLRNPVVVSIAVAFAWRLSGLSVPMPVHRLISMLGMTASPLALFCLGATLPLPQGWVALREVAVATMIKLVVMPATMFFIARAAGVTGVALAVIVLAAGMPTGANAFMLARKFGAMMEASAATVAVTTMLAMATTAFLLSLFGG